MKAPQLESRERRVSTRAEIFGIALALAIVVTGLGWFWVGKHSPSNQGVFPDVQTSPSVFFWVAANFPAAILFVNAFGKNGPEWAYFICVFLQWFSLGLGVGALIATARRAWHST